MPQSYRQISPELASQIRLVVTDIDGTLTAADNSFSLIALEAVHRLEEQGIVVGLASGRTLPRVESLARDLGVNGPIVAENGGAAKLKTNGELVDLGYSRYPAIRALEKLKRLFPHAVEETEDDRYRLVDVGIKTYGVETAELRRHLEDTEVDLLDSGFMLHLLPKEVSKGRTLLRLLGEIGGGDLSPQEVIVFGDSPTDISLFQLFPHSVLIINPGIPVQETQALAEMTEYVSDLPLGEGFAQVAFYILATRRG